MIVCGLDASTSTVGWAFSLNSSIKDAGFLKIDKFETNKAKSQCVIEFLSNHPLTKDVHHLNLEAALSGFGKGRTSQQVIIKLSRWNAVLEYVLNESFKFPTVLCNVNTMRKKVLGKSRIQGIPPKEYVKSQIPMHVSNIQQFEKLNRDGNWDVHNSDMYDAVIAALFE